ncbi:PAS fold [Kalmanozyma brasiliensis GHG001]|uniref:PAS domain-containing protein n=1 Tax=Kalmanozyma brasiliensis (strain GHG001) TaxID=1365824 RepID=V5GF93_KALBG|nr:PAS fold [Kalmanozyma brasiliensis GHG001]EST04682.1 PAS fold [Kalmanozyma brasiliensis GHG001]
MSNITPAMSNWVDVNSFDADTEKMMNSFFADASAANMSNISNNDSGDLGSGAFASAWPGPVARTNSDSAPIFGISPSLPLGVSPGLASQYQMDSSKSSNNAWSLPSDFTATLPSGPPSLNGMYSMLSDSMPPSLSNASTFTPSDAQSLQSDMMHPLGTIPSNNIPVDDMMNFNEIAKDASGSTPQLSPSSFASPPSPFVANSSLTGYHSNIASDHAAHLADLVKSSNIINAGHPGPRSLASSLSRSVLNADSIGRPDALVNHASSHNERLTIQQRRRMSHMVKSNSNAGPAEAQVEQARSPVKGRRRQNSAPDPVLPHIGSSPEMPWTPPPKQRRPHRDFASFAQPDASTSHVAAVPTSEDDVDSWMDAVVANSHDLVFVLSLKGTVLYMSPSVQRILGFHPEEIVGRPLVDFSHPADIGPFSRELKEAITLPSADGEGPDAHNATAVKAHRRVDLIMRMACKNGTFSLIETTGRVSVDPPKHRKVVVCSGRPHPVPMLPWNDVRQDLLNVELSAWLKISHNGIFLGATGPIQQILGIENINLLGRHVRDLPMVTSSSDLLDALRSGRCISVQDHYEDPTSQHKAPVKLTVYPWTSNGRSNSVSFVHVQQQPAEAAAAPTAATSVSMQQQDSVSSSSAPSPRVPAKRKASDREAQSAQQYQDHQPQTSSGSLSGSAFQANGTSVPVMTAGDAANTVFSELTGFHSGSWLIEMQKLHNANRKLRHELSALRKRSSHSSSPIAAAACS